VPQNAQIVHSIVAFSAINSAILNCDGRLVLISNCSPKRCYRESAWPVYGSKVEPTSVLNCSIQRVRQLGKCQRTTNLGWLYALDAGLRMGNETTFSEIGHAAESADCSAPKAGGKRRVNSIQDLPVCRVPNRLFHRSKCSAEYFDHTPVASFVSTPSPDRRISIDPGLFKRVRIFISESQEYRPPNSKITALADSKGSSRLFLLKLTPSENCRSACNFFVLRVISKIPQLIW
jgi:hypothetical protein